MSDKTYTDGKNQWSIDHPDSYGIFKRPSDDKHMSEEDDIFLKMECEIEDAKQQEIEELFRYVDETSTAFYRAVEARREEEARESERKGKELKRAYAFMGCVVLVLLLLVVAVTIVSPT